MNKKNIFLTILILVFIIATIFAILWYDKQNKYQIIQAEIFSFLQKEKDMDVIIRYLKEPTYFIEKEKTPFVQYYGIGCTNTGQVLIWDKRNWIGTSYILAISFKENTKKVSGWVMGL